jgi:hypothetical protein
MTLSFVFQTGRVHRSKMGTHHVFCWLVHPRTSSRRESRNNLAHRYGIQKFSSMTMNETLLSKQSPRSPGIWQQLGRPNPSLRLASLSGMTSSLSTSHVFFAKYISRSTIFGFIPFQCSEHVPSSGGWVDCDYAFFYLELQSCVRTVAARKCFISDWPSLLRGFRIQLTLKLKTNWGSENNYNSFWIKFLTSQYNFQQPNLSVMHWEEGAYSRTHIDGNPLSFLRYPL